MKLVVVSSLLACAAAFAPTATRSTSSASSIQASTDFSNEVGVQAPLGLFDPLNMLEDADQERFERLRYVELKHGRIAQLAFLGNIMTRAGIHLPGNIDYEGHSFDSYPNGLAALFGPDAIPTGGFWQIFAFIGILELGIMNPDLGARMGVFEPEFRGDLRNGIVHGSKFAWDNYTPEQKLKKRAIELNNGRAAMMGILGLMMHEKIGGSFPIIGEM